MKRGSIVRGMTLIEVIAVLTIIGVIAGVTAQMLPRAIVVAPDDPARVLAATRERALRDGSPQSARLLIDGRIRDVVALPDGSVIGDSVPLDRLTARWRHAP